jgi:hypothetical protein
MRRDRPVRLHGDPKAAVVQRRDQRVVDLEHRLAAGQHHEAIRPARPPEPLRRRCQRLGVGKTAAARPVHAHEIGVAEAAHGARAVLLTPRPQVAAGEAHEHRAAAGVHPLPLQGQEHLLDRVAHGRAA